MSNETIAAIATAQGQGGIGAVRVSGTNSIEIVDKIFRAASGKKLKEMSGYTAKFGKIYDGNEDVDDVVVLIFREPHSYTGENVVEIFCHGGLYITRKILRLVFDAGARPAQAGEFTKRSFLNGKIDLIKAESVMKIIQATGKSAARAAIAANDGAISQKIEEIKKSLIEISAKLSVWADYPDDDSFDVDLETIRETLKKAKEELFLLKNNYDKGKVLINGIKTAIVGAPNVGKSTLMNLLAGTEKSIVTEIPGTTRDIVEETVNLGEVTLHLFDTAGIRQTKDLVESIGVNKAKASVNTADLVFFVFDGSKKLQKEDLTLLEKIVEKNVIGIINKSDLKQELDVECLKKYVNDIVKISAKNGIGLEDLEKSVLKAIEKDKIEPSEGILVSERQYQNVKKALELIEESIKTIDLGLTLDAVTVTINSALEELFSLTGEKATQVVVDEIFSKFCVGK